MAKIEQGDVVWAPYEVPGDFRFRVVAVEGGIATLKRPGSDGGTFDVPVAECYRSGRAPSTLEEVETGGER